MRRALASLSAKTALIAGVLCSWPAASDAVAQTTPGPAPKAILELFTSQGCSSCPPADALMQSYANRGDVIALSFSVDYWDYLGWKDTLANPKNSARQRAYAKQRGDGRIYTPQMVVNGQTHTLGSSAQEIDQAIDASAAQFAKHRIPVVVRSEAGQLIIETGNAPDGAGIKDANIWLALIQREVSIPVKGGENHGRTITYYNVVREMTPVGMWSGKAMTIRLDREAILQPGAGSCAVLIQSGKAGPIIGAAMLAKL